MEFVKYQGIGNDYLVYDVIKNKEVLTREQIKKICDRNFGVGADGILAGPYLDEEKKIRVRVFNSDGSEAERAGNGIRIFARYLKDAGYTLSERLTLETAHGENEFWRGKNGNAWGRTIFCIYCFNRKSALCDSGRDNRP